MSEQLHVVHYYTTSVSATVTLPDDRKIADIESAYIKWGNLEIFFTDGEHITEDISGATLDDIDWKRPSLVEAFRVIGEDEGVPVIDREEDLAETLGME